MDIMDEKGKFLSTMVERFLVSKGLRIAYNTHLARSLVQFSELGIRCKDANARPRKRLFGLINRGPRWSFLGTILLNDDARGANFEENWIFEVHGRKHVELANQLVKEMMSIFNVNITLNLM